jgi:hypothetical protein
MPVCDYQRSHCQPHLPPIVNRCSETCEGLVQELSGEGVGDIEGIKGACEFKLGIEQEVTDLINRLRSRI